MFVIQYFENKYLEFILLFESYNSSFFFFYDFVIIYLTFQYDIPSTVLLISSKRSEVYVNALIAIITLIGSSTKTQNNITINRLQFCILFHYHRNET